MEKTDIKNIKKSVAIVGLGYVGLPLALLADEKGYQVIGIDVNEEKVRQINNRTSPFLDEAVERALKTSGMKATTDFDQLERVGTVVICVPTPIYENHMPNLEPVENACRSVAKCLQRGQLVVLESTVNPGVCDEVVLPLLENLSRLKCGRDFYLAHCPERINPGDKKWNVRNIPRVIGSYDEVGLERAYQFYRDVIEGEIKKMGSLKEAEAVKIVENSFRDVNIAFVNELAMSFTKLGIDVVNVIQGAATKPFSFHPHFPGCGVGGHCIPVDPYYLIEYAKDNGFHHDFLSLARRINNRMPQFTVDLVIDALNSKDIAIRGKKIAVLGLAYKADIDDCRESPSFEIVKHLRERGAEVSTFDPYVTKESTAKSLEEALEGAAAVVIATNHQIFRNLTPEFLLKRGIDVVIDGRNCLSKEAFIKAGAFYKGIGR